MTDQAKNAISKTLKEKIPGLKVGINIFWNTNIPGNFTTKISNYHPLLPLDCPQVVELVQAEKQHPFI